MRCFFLSLAIILAFTAVAQGGEPRLLKDIATRESEERTTGGRMLGSVGSKALFTLLPVSSREDLWVLDGGSPGGRNLSLENPRLSGDLTFVYNRGDEVFFLQDNHLWVTDGTAQGSHQLTFPPIHRFAPDAFLGTLDETGELLFRGTERELWATDGTVTGTRFVADVWPRLIDRSEYEPEVSGGMLFYGQTDDEGAELWITDGTEEGTRRVKVLIPGIIGGRPESLTAIGTDKVVFFASDNPQRDESVWVSDGTSQGTRKLADFPGITNLQGGFFVVDGLGYFIVGTGSASALWRTDGTPAGTFQLPVPAARLSTLSSGPLGFEGRLLFTLGSELWESDGTASGTRRVVDLCSTPCYSRLRDLRSTSVGVVFSASSDDRSDLFLTDGTAAGTRRLLSPCAGDCSPVASRVIGDLGGRLIVNGSRGSLWVSDGTPGGSALLAESLGESEYYPGGVQAGDRLVFFGRNSNEGRTGPWRTDGTVAGTSRLEVEGFEPTNSSYPEGFVAFGEGVAFFASDDEGRGLWLSDGSEPGTRLVARFPEARSGDSPLLRGLTAFRGDLYFTLSDPADVGPTAVWRSDGTASGTVRLLEAESEDGEPGRLIPAADTLYFSGPGLWRVGRTAAETTRLADRRSWQPTGQLTVGNQLYFGASNGSLEYFDLGLWTSDGTAAGTRQVLDSRTGTPFPSPLLLALFQGEIYIEALAHNGELFAIDVATGATRNVELPGAGSNARILGTAGGRLLYEEPHSGGLRLVSTDGTAAGTTVLVQNYPDEFVFVENGRLVSFDEDRMLSSDGSPEGTRLVTGLWPEFSRLEAARASGDRFVLEIFNAWLPSGPRRELWSSDGTPAGTLRVATPRQTVNLGNRSLGLVGGKLYYADGGEGRGVEPWVADASATLGPSGPPAAPPTLAAAGVSASAVRLDWRDVADESGYRVVVRGPEIPVGGAREVATLPADSTGVVVSGLPPDAPLTFQIYAFNELGRSDFSNEVSATPLRSPGPCVPSDESLCLLGGRFEVQVQWQDHRNGGNGVGHAEAFDGSDATGRFWFFDPANIELIVKQLDGRGVNGSYWSFYGALSDVPYWITVTDTLLGRNQTYYNPPGNICGRGDTTAFPAAAAASPEATTGGTPEVDLSELFAGMRRAEGLAGSPAKALQPLLATAGPVAAAGTSGTCEPSAEVLCLRDRRFEVEVSWRDQRSGAEGVGTAVTGSEESGYFWFFDAGNIELVIKILDGRPINGKMWVFYGALSDVEYSIRVVDTTTGVVSTYDNPPGNICGEADDQAF